MARHTKYKNPKTESGRQLFNKLIYSSSEKERYGFELARAVMDLVSSSSMEDKEASRMLENINMHFGRWQNVPTDGLGFEIQLEEGNFNFGRNNVNHYPVIDKYTQARVTDFINQPALGSVNDYSKHATIYKKERQKEIVVEYLRQQYIQPLIMEATRTFDLQNSVQNPLDLSEEQIRDRQSSIDSYVRQNLDPDIQKMMDNTKTLSERLFKTLLDVTLKRNDFKYKWENGAHYCEAVGTEIFRLRMGMNKVHIDNVSPVDCGYKLRHMSDFLQDGLYAHIPRYLTPIEVITECYHVLKNKDWKEIEEMLVPVPGHFYNKNDRISQRYSYTNVDRSFKLKIPVSPGTGTIQDGDEFYPYKLDGRQGVYWAQNVFDKLTEAYYSRQVGFRLDFASWRWLAKAKKVTRVDGSVTRKFIRGEHYRKNPDAGDIKVETVAIPQTYKCSKIFDLYFDIGPEEYQYKDPYDLSNPKLSVYGCEYNSFQGHIKNLSELEKAKTYQLRYNHLADTFFERIVNDLGTILYMREDVLNGTNNNPLETLSVMHKFKTLIGKKASFGKDSVSEGAVRAIDLGDRASKTEMIQILEYVESKIAGSIGSSKSKVDTPGQYANTANINAQSENIERQQYRTISLRSKLREELYNGIMKTAFYIHKDDKEWQESYLSDDLMSHYNQNTLEILGSPIYYESKDSVRDSQNLAQFKQTLINYAATNGRLIDIAESIDAQTMDEAKTIARNAEMEVEKRETRRIREAEALQQQQAAAIQQQAQFKEQAATERKSMEVKARRESALLHSLTLANANDINKNAIPDHIEKADEDRKLKKQIHEDTMELKNREIDIKEKESNKN